MAPLAFYADTQELNGTIGVSGESNVRVPIAREIKTHRRNQGSQRLMKIEIEIKVKYRLVSCFLSLALPYRWQGFSVSHYIEYWKIGFAPIA